MEPEVRADPLPLGEKEVHLWGTRVLPAGPGDGPLGWLSADEQARGERFLTPRLRRRFRVRRCFLRRVLARYLGLAPGELRFHEGPHGKPLLDTVQAGGIRFNLSHTADEVLVAVARGREVGVDVEALDRRGDLASVATRVFHPRERDELVPLAGAAWRDAFFRGWTRKEAILKALGTGLLREPRGLQVGLLPRPTDVPWAAPDPVLAAWRLVDVPAPARHRAALAAEGDDWRFVVLATSHHGVPGLPGGDGAPEGPGAGAPWAGAP